MKNYSEAFSNFCAFNKVEPTDILWSAWCHGMSEVLNGSSKELRLGADLVQAVRAAKPSFNIAAVHQVPAIVGNPLKAFTVKEFQNNFLELSMPREL